MFTKIKDYLRSWFSKGLMLPLIYDPVSEKPSVTLTCVYVTFFSALKAFWDYKKDGSNPMPACVGIMFWALAMTFYLIRKIGKAKFDLANKSLEFDNGDTNTPDKSETADTKPKVDNPDA